MSDSNQKSDMPQLGQPELPPLDGEWSNGGNSSPPPEQGAGLKDTFAMLASGLCAFIADRKGAHWNLTTEEAKNFGEAADKVAAQYIDDGQLSPWLALSLVSAMIALPRMALDKSVEKEKEAKKANESKPD